FGAGLERPDALADELVVVAARARLAVGRNNAHNVFTSSSSRREIRPAGLVGPGGATLTSDFRLTRSPLPIADTAPAAGSCRVGAGQERVDPVAGLGHFLTLRAGPADVV